MRWKVTTNQRNWGRRPCKKRAKMVSVRLTQDELRLVTVEANRRNLSLSELLRLALERLLGEG